MASLVSYACRNAQPEPDSPAHNLEVNRRASEGSEAQVPIEADSIQQALSDDIRRAAVPARCRHFEIISEGSRCDSESSMNATDIKRRLFGRDIRGRDGFRSTAASVLAAM